VGPRDDLDAVTKRKKFLPLLGLEIWSSSPEPSRYAEWDIPSRLPR